MAIRVGINGFGRMGRLALRAGWGRPGLEFVHINEMAGGPETAAHLLTFDSVHGRWSRHVEAGGGQIAIDGDAVAFSAARSLATCRGRHAWVDVVLECSGKFRTTETLDAYFDLRREDGHRRRAGEKRRAQYRDGRQRSPVRSRTHRLADRRSCTTNCLAPVVKVIHETIGIRHGVITTIHDITNTQVVVDAPHKDLRRARASSLSLIPTSTGSATAIGLIYPELLGKLTGIAVRVPLLNASLTDCVFEVQRPTTVDEVNAGVQACGRRPLEGILGYEERPLVSVDFKDDPRSAIVDAPSTMVVDGTCVKVLRLVRQRDRLRATA